MDCPKCGKDITMSEETTIVKLPDILFFTLERYIGQTNNVVIEPDEKIDFKKYLYNSIKNKINNTNYELFAINIRFGQTTSFGHEKYQIKSNGSWIKIMIAVDIKGQKIIMIVLMVYFIKKMKNNLKINIKLNL